MNTIGQLRSLIELQALKTFTDAQNMETSSASSFPQILQELAEMKTGEGIQSSRPIPMNTLGYINSRIPFLSTKTTKTLPVSNIDGAVAKEIGSAPASLENIIERAAKAYNLPAKLLKSIIRHESSFNPKAVSHAGAAGLMQLMPSTARGLGVTDIFDPEQNVMGGAKYIRSMLDKYNGNLKLALAAYNAGPGNVDKYGGIPPFKETRNYVQKVTDTYFG